MDKKRVFCRYVYQIITATCFLHRPTRIYCLDDLIYTDSANEDILTLLTEIYFFGRTSTVKPFIPLQIVLFLLCNQTCLHPSPFFFSGVYLLFFRHVRPLRQLTTPYSRDTLLMGRKWVSKTFLSISHNTPCVKGLCG